MCACDYILEKVYPYLFLTEWRYIVGQWKKFKKDRIIMTVIIFIVYY